MRRCRLAASLPAFLLLAIHPAGLSPGAEPAATIRGDLNEDAFLDAGDLFLLRRVVDGQSVGASDQALDCADFNGDEQLTETDFATLVFTLLGDLPAEECPPPPAYPPINSVTIDVAVLNLDYSSIVARGYTSTGIAVENRDMSRAVAGGLLADPIGVFNSVPPPAAKGLLDGVTISIENQTE